MLFPKSYCSQSTENGSNLTPFQCPCLHHLKGWTWVGLRLSGQEAPRDLRAAGRKDLRGAIDWEKDLGLPF